MVRFLCANGLVGVVSGLPAVSLVLVERVSLCFISPLGNLRILSSGTEDPQYNDGDDVDASPRLEPDWVHVDGVGIVMSKESDAAHRCVRPKHRSRERHQRDSVAQGQQTKNRAEKGGGKVERCVGVDGIDLVQAIDGEERGDEHAKPSSDEEDTKIKQQRQREPAAQGRSNETRRQSCDELKLVALKDCLCDDVHCHAAWQGPDEKEQRAHHMSSIPRHQHAQRDHEHDHCLSIICKEHPNIRDR
mmetsp:Transcript_10337/g.31630  ORF Transcript_10337/g.31630 Transcript_10337/m.31630 type:complete len:246 (-) Transcript_10337:117-854(-)